MRAVGSESDVFQRGGELGALMRSYDWSATPLGPPESWPRSLQSIVRMMLTSRYQMWMAWGPELTFFCNDAYRPTLGVKFPWALGQPASQVWAEIWGEIGPMIDTVLTTGEATYSEGMLLFLERSGFPEETYHTFSYSPLFGDDGRIEGMFCVVVEETERVLNERRLGTVREFASAAAVSTGEAELFAAIGRELSRNTADLPFTLTYLTGSDAPRLIARSGTGDDFPPAGFDWSVRDGIDGAQMVENLAQLGTVPAGQWDKPPERALVEPIPLGSGGSAAGFLVVGLNPYRPFDTGYRDFLDLLANQIGAALAAARAYEEERDRAAALAEIDRAKTAFFSNVSHEFRTPLTLMLGPLEEAMATPADGDIRERQRQLELAHRNGVRLLRLVNSLLDFSRIEAGRVEARNELTDLAAFSADIASSFRSAMDKAGLAFEIVTRALPHPVSLDRDMWEKILLNLLSNAFKFTLQGSVTVTVQPSSDPGMAEVRVADTGIGIAPEELLRLFERFHRVEGAAGRTFEGSGIGLALVQELVRLHGGAIEATSQLGQGTEFIIRLPYGAGRLPGAPDRTSEPSRNAAAFVEEAMRWLPEPRDLIDDSGGMAAMVEGAVAGGARAGNGKRVLLADDNADMRDYVARLLIAQGYAVETVVDGEAALAAARRQPPDLILSDVMMPRLDGFGLLRAIRLDTALAGTPVILLSARAGEEAKVEGLGEGADDYLVKPFAARELLARVGANIQLAAIRREATRAMMRSEQKALLTEERLDVALSTGEIAIFEFEVETGETTVMGPLARLFGVPPAVASMGLPLSAFFEGIDPADRDHVSRLIADSIENGTPYEAEYRVTGEGGRIILARGSVEETATGGKRLVGALIDVTAEKEAQSALRALNLELEERVAGEVRERLLVEEALRQAQKMEAIGQLTGGVAHDFNNLLTVIIGGLDTIRRSGPADNARLTRALEMAMQGAERAVTLTARLLAFSRRQPLDPKPVDLNLIVRDSTELLHRTLGEQIELEGVLAPRLWSIEVDQNQLESAILNLAVNARDAMPEGGKLTLETANTMLDESYTATDSEVVPGQYVALSITDNGAGMTKETIERVFEPFFTTKEVGKGTGLGLSMVYGFVKQSGGHVTIYSEPGQGTTVKLYFPRFLGNAEGPADRARSAVPRGQHDEIVLVVEDNDDVRAYSVMILKELGYGVIEAVDAEAAMKIITRGDVIDLLFTDVVLPGKTGRMLATEALTLRPDLKVLFTTGYSRNAIVHHGRLDHGVHLLTKPFTFEQLANRVRDVLDQDSRGR